MHVVLLIVNSGMCLNSRPHAVILVGCTAWFIVPIFFVLILRYINGTRVLGNASVLAVS